MTFTFTNYAGIAPQASPMQDIIGKILGGYTDTTKARYLQPSLQEALKKAQLENQYYAPNMESQIGLRGAQSGLIGEQTKGARIENQYLPQKMQAAIQESQANAQKARLMQMIREQLIGGGQAPNNENMQAPQQNMRMLQGQGMPAGMNQQQEMMQQPNMQQPGMQPQGIQQGANGYAQAATAMQMLGLGKPHVVEANGRYIAITPFGNVDTGVAGLTEQGKTLAKEDAKKISDLENIVLRSDEKTDTFKSLNEDIGSHEFEELRRNPILGRHEIGWYEKFGTKEQQEMIGRVKTNMGNIIKASARDFAGQFRTGEQALLNDMKPNVGDSLEVMKGKSEALTFLNTIATKRAELEADYMRNYNMNALQARIATNKSIDPNEIKKEIRTILHPAKKLVITPDMAMAELKRRQAAGQQ
jgi:hypothetical protein